MIMMCDVVLRRVTRGYTETRKVLRQIEDFSPKMYITSSRCTETQADVLCLVVADLWAALGGKKEYQTSERLESSRTQQPRLFACSNKTGRFLVSTTHTCSPTMLTHIHTRSHTNTQIDR